MKDDAGVSRQYEIWLPHFEIKECEIATSRDILVFKEVGLGYSRICTTT